MSSTAFDDQFTVGTQTIVLHQAYDTTAILRRNVADLEIALRKQTERAEQAEEKLTTAREDMQSWIDSRNGWMERAGAAEQELKELREQVPLTFVHDPNGYAIGGTHTEIADALPVGTDLYTRPIPAPAPAVPEDWREAAQQLIDAAGDKTCSSLRCNYPMDCCSHELIGAMDAMSALLQSAPTGEPK